MNALEVPESETKHEQYEDSDLKYFVYRAIEQDVLVQNPSSSNDASVLEKIAAIATNNQHNKLFSVKRSIAEAAVVSEGNFAIQVVNQQKQYVAKLTNQERMAALVYGRDIREVVLEIP
ncbi:hypothetical protein DAPPUDRAFT_244270 [Daphnia pulex]|uniref:Uncharacterized protein n=1 Tax=Daphnia pulex TaxID=6669 RepID=E9GKK7_DAPPU|nr:hypothetical protein DAPPUDRAFT_244270 [Daphnia pulex]|eukprot:EFX80046.1 hypothetical protein DAPPUDRAFT_244270 [Daphnia pulex]